MADDAGDMQGNRKFWAPLAIEYGEYNSLKAGSIDDTCNVHVRGISEHTLFVARLNHETREDQLKSAFSKYGKIESCRLVRDVVTGRSKSYAFIEYQDRDDAESAYYHCHRMALDGAQLLVEFEHERILPGWIPRRFGGGYGGRKESGQLRFGGRDRPFRKPIVLGSKPLGTRGPDRRPGSRADRDTRRRSDEFSRRERLSRYHSDHGHHDDRRN